MATYQRLVLAPAPAPRPAYPSDLTDAQWALLEPLLRERDSPGPGRPASVPLREIVNALLYIKQTGCPWRYLPHDLPPRSTVHYYFEKWTADGTLEEVGRHLRERSRRRAGRAVQPTAGIRDSPTAKSGEATHEVGWDGGK
jgi:transposase